MMKLFSTLVILLTTHGALAQPLMLVSEDEMINSNQNKPRITPKSTVTPNAPSIDLLAPQLGSSVSSPTQIDLKFLPKNQSEIKPETFKAYYGTFQVDITSRLLKVTKVTTQGVNVAEASLPKGSHRITLKIEDTEGRIGSKTIEFEVK
jgi:hypothetical protein